MQKKKNISFSSMCCFIIKGKKFAFMSENVVMDMEKNNSIINITGRCFCFSND